MTNEEKWKAMKEYAEKFRESQSNSHANGVCPSCGYCPHCGRGQQLMPHYQRPYWYGQWQGPAYVVTCGTSPFSGNLSGMQAWQNS